MSETVLKLSPEEHYELKQLLEASVNQELKAVERMRAMSALNGPGGVIERAEHSINILTDVLRKLS